MDDLISRQAAIDGIREIASCCDVGHEPEDYVYMLQNLPSVQPERKKGKWIADSGMIYCPECRYGFDGIFKRYYNFCPNCGADMRGEQHETD